MFSISRRTFRTGLLIVIAAGIALRLALILPSGWRIDYDEAMVGLLGLRVLRGEFMAFIPAQATLGAVEPYLLAPLFALIGATPLAMRVLSLILSAAYIGTTGLLARAAFDETVGLIAGGLAAVAPPYLLITGMKIWGGTIETIVLGNVLLLVAGRVVEEHRTQHAPQALPAVAASLLVSGFIAGLMFWTAWLGFYYFVPVGLVLLWRGRRALRRGWWIGLIGFFVGSAPFWLYNLTHQWATFAQIFSASDYTPADVRAIVQHMLSDLVPRLVTGDLAWGSGALRWSFVPVVIYYAGLIVLLAAVRLWWDRSGDALRWMLALFVLCVPFMYLLSGYGQTALNPWGLDATGRYVLMLHTALPIGVALLAVTMFRMRHRIIRWVGVAVLVGAVGVNLWGVLRTDPARAFDSPYYDRLPGSLAPLIDALDARGIRHVWIDNGIGHVLMFVTRERILAADYYDTYLADGFLRFPDVLSQVEAADRTAFVVPVYPGQQNPPIERALDAAGVTYESFDVLPTLRMYVPESHLDPAVIAAGLGYQY